MIKYAPDLDLMVKERTQELQVLIQQHKEARDELSSALAKEREMNQMMSRFISMASHEFRSPLSTIQLSASLIEHYYARLNPGKIKAHLQKIIMAVNNMTDIMDDFLSVERIDGGKIHPEYKQFDLPSFCKNIIDEIKTIDKGSHSISYRHIGKDDQVTLDSNMLKHCIVNLVSNAAKYSNETGLVELKTEISERECLISVKDNGIGIPQEDRQHLFEAFFRADNARDIPGTGLGLNIVERYTHLMGGKIKLKSSLKSGTIFTLTFPVKNFAPCKQEKTNPAITLPKGFE